MPDLRHGLWSAVAALVALTLAAPMLQAPLSIYDGGITASAATFILHGQIPYRDFWLLYGPLTAYVAAALTGIFGNDVTILRLAGMALVATTAVLGYRLVCARVPGIAGMILAVVAAGIGVQSAGLDLSPWAVSMALVLCSILVARDPTSRRLTAAGVLLGLAVLARQDLGAYALIAVCIATRSPRPLIGAVILLVPVAALLVVAVPLPALIQQLIWYPLVGPREFRGLPAPALTSLVSPGGTLAWLLYWPPLVLIGAAVARLWRSRSISPTFIALLILAILCRFQTLGRADNVHNAEAAVPAILLVAYAFDRPRRFATRALTSVAIAVALATIALPVTSLNSPVNPYDVALRAAASQVQLLTQPNEPIFVGESANLHTLLNPLIAYYLADRPAGVRDTMYNPGVTNTATTQAEMVADLATNRVRFLILDVRYANCFETTNESQLPGSDILDAVIKRDYAVVANYGSVEIMGLKGSVGPLPAPQIYVDPTPPPPGLMTCPSVTNP